MVGWNTRFFSVQSEVFPSYYSQTVGWLLQNRNSKSSVIDISITELVSFDIHLWMPDATTTISSSTQSPVLDIGAMSVPGQLYQF